MLDSGQNDIEIASLESPHAFTMTIQSGRHNINWYDTAKFPEW